MMDWTINVMGSDDSRYVYELYVKRQEYIATPPRQRFVTQCIVTSHERLFSDDYRQQLVDNTLYLCTDSGRVYLYHDEELHCVETQGGRNTFSEEDFAAIPLATQEISEYDPFIAF